MESSVRLRDIFRLWNTFANKRKLRQPPVPGLVLLDGFDSGSFTYKETATPDGVTVFSFLDYLTRMIRAGASLRPINYR